jgi:hypothetical protein
MSAVVIIDYQNIHLSAHEQFCRAGEPKHHSLIHPLYFANEVMHARRVGGLGDSSMEATSLAQVVVFRGLPSNLRQPELYRRCLAQKSEWTKDSRVEVNYRSLRYRRERDGRWVAREKGIDILVALEVVKATECGSYDTVVLATHDLDLEPALEYVLDSNAARTGKVRIETAGWSNCKRLQVPGHPMVHTALKAGHFGRVRDGKGYR